MTVKSDYEEGKKQMMESLIRTCQYEFPTDIKFKGGTKRVVETLIEFLKD